MKSPYEELVERIRGETADLDTLVKRALTAWNQIKEPALDQKGYT